MAESDPAEMEAMAVRSRQRANRVLTALALVAILLGIGFGQALITWLNATLL
jgi:hypothetical protein